MAEKAEKKVLLKNFSLKEKIILLAALVIAGVLLVCLSSGGNNKMRNECAIYEEKLEEDLTGILTRIEGAKDLTVMVTAQKSAGDNDGYDIVGVAVAICGEPDPILEEKIVKTVKTVLGITANRITVVAGKNN